MNAKKLLSTLLSAAMAVSMLAGCFGGGGNKNYSDKAADAANAAQSTVVFATDAKLSKSLQDALENFTQLDDIKDAMEADENLKSLLTSGWDLDVVAEQGEDAEAAAKAIAEKYILSIVSGKKAEGKIAMVLHDGNGYYYVAVLTYGNGGSGSGGGAGGGSGSGDDGQGGNPGGGDDDKPGPDDEENNPGGGDDDVIYYSVTTNAQGGSGHYNTPSRVEKGQELSFTVTADKGYEAVVTAMMGGEPIGLTVNGNCYTYGPVTDDIVIDITFAKKAPEQFILNMGVNDVDGGKVSADIDGNGTKEDFLGDTFVTAGEDFTFTVTPNDNYEIEKVTATRNGESRKLSEKNGTYTVEDIQSDVKVLVTFAEKAPSQYMVNVSVNDTNGGTVSADIDGDGQEEGCLGDSFVNAGEDFDFTVTPDEGYEIYNVTVERGNGRVETLALTANNKYTASKIESDTDITVTFAPIQVTVTLQIEGDGDGTVTFNGEPIEDRESITVDFKDEVAIEATAGTDSELVSISDGSNNLENGATIYPSGNITITVTFELAEPVLTNLYAKPDSITRYVGQTFKKDDLKIYAVYDNDSANPVPVDIDDCKVTGAPYDGELTAEGTYTVKVTFGNQTAEVTVIVKKPYVTGIKVTTTGTGNILREYRAFPSPSDTVFKVYKYEKTGGSFWLPEFEWVEEYRDDITITIEYMGQDSLVIDTPKELKKYVEAGQLTAEEFTSPGFGFYNTQTVTISYKDNTMTQAVDTEIDVTVTWIKPNT